LSQARPDYFKEKPIVVFDHHLGDGLDHGVVVKDVKSISACEVVFEHTHKWRPELFDKDIATYFYL
jgi:nanoRNase/pAp phosphatase (c-di-AMP/oligoRNAs hydrolase)